MILRVAILLAVVGVAIAATRPSGASFTKSVDTNTQQLKAEKTGDWLRQFTQSTDPGGLTGYRLRGGVPAATGSDGTVAVNMGTLVLGGLAPFKRVWTIQVPATLPEGATQTTVTVSSDQPTVVKAELENLDGTGAATSRTVAAGTQLQVTVTMIVLALGTTNANFTVSATPAGTPAGWFSYTVPFTCLRVL